MKAFMLYILMFSAGTYFAQSPAKGLYQSAEDLVNRRALWYDEPVRIRIHEVFNGGTVEVNYHDSIYHYQKKALYGYIDKEGNSYRFLNNDSYLVINPGEKILIYRHSSGTGFRGSPKTDTYFFSKEAGSAMQPLTLQNTETAFSENTSFLLLIETYFRNNDELWDYDSIHHEYKLNRLLELSRSVSINTDKQTSNEAGASQQKQKP